MKKLLLLSIITILFASCNPEEITPNQPQENPQNTDAPLPPDPVSTTPPPTVNFSNLPEWTTIPDANFENALINKGIDDVFDGKVLTTKVSHLTTLKIEHAGITNTKGIESFLSLEVLSFWDNNFTTIDLSHNVLLKILCLSECPLNTVDLSKNTELVELDFQGNDMRNNDPTYLYGKTLGMTSLDLSRNVKLERIYLYCNRLTSLNVRMLPKLTDLWLGNSYQGTTGGNYIKTLDLTGNPRLMTFIAMGGTLEYVDARATGNGTAMGNVALINNPNLTKVRVTNLSLILQVNSYPLSAGQRKPWWYDATTQLVQ